MTQSVIDAGKIAARLADDRRHNIKAVAVVHSETSTGVTSDIAAVRRAMDSIKHPALRAPPGFFAHRGDAVLYSPDNP